MIQTINKIETIVNAPSDSRKTLLESLFKQLVGEPLAEASWLLKGLGFTSRPLPAMFGKNISFWETSWRDDDKKNCGIDVYIEFASDAAPEEAIHSTSVDKRAAK